jgi:hypothetical protein
MTDSDIDSRPLPDPEELKDVKAALKTKRRFLNGCDMLEKLLKQNLSRASAKSLYHALDILTHNCTKEFNG